MPHRRQRGLLAIFKKRLQLHPCMGLLGARQTGKSTFLKNILSENVPLEYYTMDSKNQKTRAENSPESFTEPLQGKVKVLDEVQKVPDLFDAVKFHVDQKRRPGMYILSGSTEFSSLAGIRESLTGRIGISYLYPFNLSEIHGKQFGLYFSKNTNVKSILSLSEFDKKIRAGGMPGFFHLHSKEEWSQSCQTWIETTCFRDVAKVLKKSFDPELSLNIFAEACRSTNPTAADIAAVLNTDPRVVKRYLEAFTQILVLIKVSPHSLSTGKDHYLPLDCGLVTYFQAPRSVALRTHVLIEALSHFENHETSRPQISYYQSAKKSHVPLIFYWPQSKKLLAVQISDSESPKRGELASLDSFQKKLQNQNVRCLVLNQSSTSYKENGIEFHPLRG